MIFHYPILRPLALLIAVIGLTACQPALIYGERTSFNLAAIQLNDDVSEPVKIKIGLSRSVATVAPPRGGIDQEQKVKPTDTQ